MAKAEASRLGRASTKEDSSPTPDEGVDEAPETQPEHVGKTVLFRGQHWPVLRTVRVRQTGAIYDYFRYTRSVRDRQLKTSEDVTLTRRKRRAGTGFASANTEDTYEG